MPASSPRSGFWAIGETASRLFLILAVLWAGAYAVASSRTSLRLYHRQFGTTVAHQFAAAMAKVARERRSVLLMGASSTHEAFDEALMNAVDPSLRFVNGGTAMGSVFVYEAMAMMLREYGIHPGLLAIALHPVALADRQVNFNAAGYTDFFDDWHGGEIVRNDDPKFISENLSEVQQNTIWPGHRLARQTSRLLRTNLLALHKSMYWGPVLPREAFELGTEDLRPQPQYFYKDTVPLASGAIDGVRWFESTTKEWAAPRHLASLRRTLDISLQTSARVVVLLMPEHSELRERVSARLRGPILSVVAEYRARGVLLLDLSAAVSDAQFRDSIHLLGSGRPGFSREVASVLAAQLRPDAAQGH